MSSSSSDEDEPRRYGRRLRKNRGSKRNKALDELRQLREHGIKRSEQFELDESDRVYDVVDEEQYAEIVRKRREMGDFVVDDDGTGYMDDGEEHFWEHDQSGTEVGEKRNLEGEDYNKARRKKRKEIKSLEISRDQNQNISSMFVKLANANEKKTTKELENARKREAEIEASLKDESLESMLDSLVKSKSTKKYKNRKSVAKHSIRRSRGIASMNSSMPTNAIKEESSQLVEDEVMQGTNENVDATTAFTQADSAEEHERFAEQVEKDETKANKEAEEIADVKKRLLSRVKSKPIRKIAAPKNETPPKSNKDGTSTSTFMSTPPLLNPGSQWNHDGAEGIMAQTDENMSVNPAISRNSHVQFIERDDGTYLRMFWIDLYEDQYNIPGKVFLIGKVWCSEQKNYISCCVEVRNLERVLYFLPRTEKKSTGEKVSMVDVHKEVKEILNRKLSRDNNRTYRMKMVERNYAFELPDIPREPHPYLKVKYPMEAEKNGQLNQDLQGDTFSRVFGTHQSGMSKQ